MSNTTKMNKTAPFLSIDAFGQEDKIEEHYKKWLQYEVANGNSAKSWQQTFDVDLLEILKRRKNIEFKESVEQGKDESSEHFRERRLKDAEQVAKALFDLQMPTVRSDAKTAIIAKCGFTAHRKTSLVAQILQHEMKFLNASKHIGATTALELCEAYIACFPQAMQAELNIVGAEDKVKKTRGFLQWTEYADWVNGKAQLVHETEAALKLFYPKLKTISLLVPLKPSDQAWLESPKQHTPPRGSTLGTLRGSQEPSEDRAAKKKKARENDRCFKCGQFGHFIGECPSNEEEVQVRGRAKSTGPSSPRDQADSVDVHNRRSTRIAEKTEKLAS